MVLSDSLLVSLIKMIDRIPIPPAPAKRPRGRPVTYPDRLLLKALVIMIIRRLYTAWALLRFLDQAEPLVQQVRSLLSEHGRFPSCRTWERRLQRLPRTLPALIGCLGRHLVQVLNPWGQPRPWRGAGQRAAAYSRRRVAQEAPRSGRGSAY